MRDCYLSSLKKYPSKEIIGYRSPKFNNNYVYLKFIDVHDKA